MSQALRIAVNLSDVSHYTLQPSVCVTTTTRTPCNSEFLDLIQCLRSFAVATTTCVPKYKALKSCLHAHGLS